MSKKLGQRITNASLAFVLALSTVTASMPFVFSQEAAAADTTEVIFGNTSAGENQPGWMFNRDASTSTPFEFNTDASSVGSGSLYVKPIGGVNKDDKFIAENFVNSPISDINSVSYDFKIGNGGNAADKDHFYMSVYANFGESNDLKFYDCRYNVIPAVGSTSDFTTVTFDPTQSYPVTTRTGLEASPYTCPTVPADMDTLSSGSNIRVFAINVGDTSLSDAGLDGYLDNVVVDKVSDTITYDFEADTARPVVSFVNPSMEGQAFSGNASIAFEGTDNAGLSSMVVNIKDSANSGHLGACGSVSNLGGVASHTLSCTINTKDFADGSYYLRAGATDINGNNKTISRKVVFDNTKPSATISTPANGEVVPSSVTIMGDATDNTSGIESVKYTVTEITGIGGTYVDSVTEGTATYDEASNIFEANIQNLTNGFYRLKVQAFDHAGNHRYKYVDVRVDSTKPIVNLVSPTKDAVQSTEQLVIEAVDELALKKVVANIYKVGVDGVHKSTQATIHDGATNYTHTVALTTLSEGKYYVKYNALDTANNLSQTKTFHFTVDNTKPTAHINSPSDNSYVTTNDFTVKGTASDALSGIDHVNIYIAHSPWSNGGYVVNNQLATYDPSTNEFSYDAVNIPDGTFVIKAVAYDKAGNIKYANSVNITVDTTAPVQPTGLAIYKGHNNDIANLLECGNYTNDTKIRIAWDANPESDIAYYWFGTKFNTHHKKVTNKTYYDGNMTPGNNPYYYTVIAVDHAGNESVISDQCGVELDTEGPTVPVIQTPFDGQYFNTAPILNNWTDSTDALSGLSHYQIEYVYDDGHTFSNAPYRETTVSQRNHSPAPWEQGGVTIRVRAYDNAGNISAWSNPVHYYYDSEAPSAPTLTSPFDGIVMNGLSITQSWNSTDTDVDHFIYESYNDAAALSLRWDDVYNTTSKTATNVADSTYWWRVKAVDHAGNVSDWSDLWKITVDNVAPVATIINPLDGALVNGTVVLKGEVTDANPMNSHFRIEGPNGYVKTNTKTTGLTLHELSWDTTGLDDGVYTIYFETRDKAQNKDGSISSLGDSVDKITVTVDNSAPVITFVDFAENGNVITPNITADDPNGPLTYSWTPANSDSAANVTVSDPTALTPDFTVNVDGTYTFNLVVTDSLGNLSVPQAFTFTYTTPVPPETNDDNNDNGGTTTANGTNGGFTDVALNETDDTGVLGTQTQNPDNSLDGETENNGVLGTVDAQDAAGNIFGLAWYWWLAILAALAALISLLVALWRRYAGSKA